MRIFLLALASWSAVLAQPGLPSFGQFVVSRVYTGPVSMPKIADDDLFSMHCLGMNPQDRRPILGVPRVNFAGLYVINPCTCGTGCHSLMLWNARTGEVLSTGLGSIEWHYRGRVPATYYGTVERYRANSRLLKVHGCLDWSYGDTANCGKFFYELRGQQLALIKKVPMPLP